MTKKPLVVTVILNWQQPKLTVDTLKSLSKISHSTFSHQIYLVDNGSQDDSVIQIKKYTSLHSQHIKFFSLPTNKGFSVGNNYGISKAINDSADYILLLNNDVIVHKQFLEKLLDSFGDDNKIGMVCPKIYFAPGHEYHKHRYKKSEIGKVIWSAGGYIDWPNVYGHNRGIDEVDRGQYDQPLTNLEFATNCCVLIKSTCIKKVGLMPDDYFVYCEDMDFCQSFIKQGYKISYNPKSIIWHINSGSSKAGGGACHDYFLTRNRLIFGFKYANVRTKLALLRQSVCQLFTGTPWQKKGIVDYFLGKKQQGSWTQ